MRGHHIYSLSSLHSKHNFCFHILFYRAVFFLLLQTYFMPQHNFDIENIMSNCALCKMEQENLLEDFPSLSLPHNHIMNNFVITLSLFRRKITILLFTLLKLLPFSTHFSREGRFDLSARL